MRKKKGHKKVRSKPDKFMYSGEYFIQTRLVYHPELRKSRKTQKNQGFSELFSIPIKILKLGVI